MEIVSKNLKNYHRIAPLAMPTNGICYMSREWPDQDTTHRTVDFLVILDGEGLATSQGKTWRIIAPAVLVILPGIRIHHRSPKGWEIFWAYYEPKYRKVFEAVLKETGSPVWRLKAPRECVRLIHEIREQCRLQDFSAGGADRMDRLCEALITECVLGRIGADGPGESFHEIVAWMEEHYLDFGVETASKRFGMSKSLFYQRWRRYMTVSPAHYAMQLRIAKARECLGKTDARVREVAERVKFQDPLYFSRKFRQFTGMSPSQYRANAAHRSTVPSQLGRVSP